MTALTTTTARPTTMASGANPAAAVTATRSAPRHPTLRGVAIALLAGLGIAGALSSGIDPAGITDAVATAGAAITQLQAWAAHTEAGLRDPFLLGFRAPIAPTS